MSVRCWRPSDGPAPRVLVELSCRICGLEVEWVNGAIPTTSEGCAVLLCPAGHESLLLLRLVPTRSAAPAAPHPSEVGLVS